MKFQLFSVFDSMAENFNTPMFVAAKGIAIRAFDDQANNPESQINKHAADYTLFFIGEFDDSTGQITSVKPQSHGTGADFIKSEA